MGVPGQEYFAGTHFNPNVTWWDMAGELSNTSTASSSSRSRGGSRRTRSTTTAITCRTSRGSKEETPPGVLPGYDYDLTNEEVLLRLSVEGRRVRLPHGQSYRLLVLPDHKILSLAALKKVYALINAGATVLGPKTERTASLMNFPQSESEVRRLADKLWGATPTASGERRIGRGRVVWGKTRARGVARRWRSARLRDERGRRRSGV